MSKTPNKVKTLQEIDEDDEIVSFEAFSDHLPPRKGKTDILTLNDNINYRLHYELDGSSNSADKEEDSSIKEKETSLNDNKSVSWKRKTSATFAPFGRYCSSSTRGSLFNTVIPKSARNDESGSEPGEHRYTRFSENRSLYRRMCENLPSLGSGVLLLALLCVLSVGVWWGVYGVIGEAWSEEHYRRLWLRAHPEKEAPTHFFAGGPHPDAENEVKYHDHNNLSTKNKLTAAENAKKIKDSKKMSAFLERPLPVDGNICANVKDVNRFNCYPEDGANERGCLQRGCCWKPVAAQPKKPGLQQSIGIPYCFYPPKYGTYAFVNMTQSKDGITAFYAKQRDSAYADNFNILRIDIRFSTNDIVQIKMWDGGNDRFEPTLREMPVIVGPRTVLKYRVELENERLGFRISRADDNVTIFDTQDVGGLIMADKFMQVSAVVASRALYGLGERRGPLMLDADWQRHTIFNYDTPPAENTNLYGYQPFYMCMEDSGKSHGLLLLNTNALEVVLQPTPAVTFRTIGGLLNFFLFLGPSPAEVVEQYTNLVGRPFMPPYWALGFHLSKFNYGGINETREVWRRTREAEIPYDVQWNDLDYMSDGNDFTYDHVKYRELPQFVDALHDEGMRYVPLIDAGVSASEPRGTYPPYDLGEDWGIFITNHSQKPFVGKVWNAKSTVWPDFTHPEATTYWVKMLSGLHKEIAFDGLWLDMNEPSNFLDGGMYDACLPENLTYAPHVAGAHGLRSKTLCMDARHYAGTHYDVHCMHSLVQTIVTSFVLQEIRGKRPFIISRSTYTSHGHYGGHWSGDILSDWHDMRMTIPEMLSFSMFGVSMMGADICGFRGNATAELCKRWMQLGAFYPFARNHNSDSSIPQDPVALGPEVTRAAREFLRLRYALLPYLYTAFWRAHVYGETVATPLFFQFPKDRVTYPIDQQYLLGPAVMVCPILQPGVTSVRAYLPNERWYAANSTRPLPTAGWVQLNEHETVLIKGGSVLPLQKVASQGPVTTTRARSRPLQLLAAPCLRRRAHGHLYWDDGDSLNTYAEQRYSHIKFSLANNTLRSEVVLWGYGVPLVDKIFVLGQPPPAGPVYLNKAPVTSVYDPDLQRIAVFPLSLSLDKEFTLSW